MSTQRLLIVEVAGLGYELSQRYARVLAPLRLVWHPLAPVFPAVTCTVQASLRTGLTPAQHGVICNGYYDRWTRRTDFWNQSAALLPPDRVWADFRRRGGTVGTLFWQQSLGDEVELVLSPAPIHKHHGGMIQDCYSQPPGLYRDLCRAVGARFSLMHYWGPLASARSTEWIASATVALLQSRLAPGLLLTYLPHLDYVLQRYGPNDERRVAPAMSALAGHLTRLLNAAAGSGYAVLIWGDYAIAPAHLPEFPNRALRDAGLFRVRQVNRHSYPDFHTSLAFAMVDHQVAHVYVRRSADLPAVRRCLEGLPGVDTVFDHGELDHPRSGELIAVAKEGAWFAYPWWDDDREAPEYARHVDIHSKPGFDPCELFWGSLPLMAISLQPGRVRGTHGRAERPACFATSLGSASAPGSLTGLSGWVREVLRDDKEEKP